MIRKRCVFCGQDAFHNPTTKKYAQNDGEWRCTRCGYPTTTNQAKREMADKLMRKIAGRI